MIKSVLINVSLQLGFESRQRFAVYGLQRIEAACAVKDRCKERGEFGTVRFVGVEKVNRGPTLVVKTSGFPLFVVVGRILVGGHDGCQRNPVAVTKCVNSSWDGITDRNRSIVENGECRKQ